MNDFEEEQLIASIDDFAKEHNLNLTFSDYLEYNTDYKTMDQWYSEYDELYDMNKGWDLFKEYLENSDSEYYQISPYQELIPLSLEEVKEQYEDEVIDQKYNQDFDDWRMENEIYSNDELTQSFENESPYWDNQSVIYAIDELKFNSNPYEVFYELNGYENGFDHIYFSDLPLDDYFEEEISTQDKEVIKEFKKEFGNYLTNQGRKR